MGILNLDLLNRRSWRMLGIRPLLAMVLATTTVSLTVLDPVSAAAQDGLRIKNVASAAAQPTQADEPQFLVRTARVPIFVNIDLAAAGGTPAVPDDAVNRVVAALDANPRRLITLRFKGGALRFNDLTRSTREALLDKKGNEVIDAYNRYMAGQVRRLIGNVDAARAGAPIAVQGIPFEGGSIEVASANSAYRPIIDRLNAIVVAGGMMLTGSSDEVGMLRRSYPQAIAALNNRAIMFAANGGWRIATLTDGDVKASVAGVASESDKLASDKAVGVDPATQAELGELALLGSVASENIATSDLEQVRANGDSTLDEASAAAGVGSMLSGASGGGVALGGAGGSAIAGSGLASSEAEEVEWTPGEEVAAEGVSEEAESEVGDNDQESPSDEFDAGADGSSTDSENPSELEDGDVYEAGLRPLDIREAFASCAETVNYFQMQAIIDAAIDGSEIDLRGTLVLPETASDQLAIVGKGVKIRGGVISGAIPLDWNSTSDPNVYVADIPEGLDLSDPRYYLLDPLQETPPRAASWPTAEQGSSRGEYSALESWFPIRLNNSGVNDVLTVAGPNEFDAKISGCRVADPQIRDQIEEIMTRVGDPRRLSALYHSGPNLVAGVPVIAWDAETGVLEIDTRRGLPYYGYMRLGFTGSPVMVEEPGQFALDPLGRRVTYWPASGTPGGMLPVVQNPVLISNGALDLEDSVVCGGAPGPDGVLIRGSEGEPCSLVLRGAVLCSGQRGVTRCSVDMQTSYVHRFLDRGLILHSGSRVLSSRLERCENRSLILVGRTFDGRIEETVIEGNLLLGSGTVHGQGISLYWDSWQSASVVANIFLDCERAVAFQPQNGDLVVFDGEFRFDNNLVAVSDGRERLMGGQQGFSFNGLADEHLPEGKRVFIRHNSFVQSPGSHPDWLRSVMVDVGNLIRSDVRVESNVAGSISGPRLDSGSPGHWHLSNLITSPMGSSSHGLFDLPDSTMSFQLLGDDGMTPLGVAASAAIDGGPIGIRWAVRPGWDLLSPELPLDWASYLQPSTVPDATVDDVGRVWFGQDLRP